MIDLIAKLLEFEPQKRITASQALSHPFFHELTQPKATASSDAVATGKRARAVATKRTQSAGKKSARTPNTAASKKSEAEKPEVASKAGAVKL